MRKFLLSIIITLATAVSAAAVDWQWGTPTWNIQDGWEFQNFEDYEQSKIILTYPNPSNYQLNFFQMLAVEYNVYVDGAEEPQVGHGSARQSTAIELSYDFLEGHSYRVVTTGTVLAQANLATYTTDTLYENHDSYTISFSIKGPELVKTINVEGTTSLAITDQEDPLTFSLIDSKSVIDALGVTSIDEATIFGLQVNGAYVPYEWYGPDYFDGWRDDDGNYTTWNGGYNKFTGHNAYPAVYSIKLNQTCDTVKYYFYDYWKEYDPDDSGEQGGGQIQGAKGRFMAKAKAPETHYQNMIWEWDNGDGTTTKYTRYFRCVEGTDYKASFVVKANNKYVQINAVMHFVSIDDYNNSQQAVLGDVNGDNTVNITDVVGIINAIANGENNPITDINSDGTTNITDVVIVINIIAGN